MENSLIAENLADEALVLFNNYSKYPLFHLFSREESGQSDIERKLTPSGQEFRKKMIKLVLKELENEQSI